MDTMWEPNGIYDQEGHPMESYDEDAGHLVEETRVNHHPAAASIAEQGHWETLREYPGGGKDVAWVVDVPGVEGHDAWDEDVTVLIYVPYTAAELAELAAEKAEEQAAALRKEVQAALIAAQINTLAVDDATALRWRVLYPAWAAGETYETGVKVQHADRLWRCLQGHTAQAGWEPEGVPALWTEICESHAGTADDPIPYNGNMALEQGKYYSQDGVTYRCTRDTVNPVYHPLAALAGLYVEVA